MIDLYTDGHSFELLMKLAKQQGKALRIEYRHKKSVIHVSLGGYTGSGKTFREALRECFIVAFPWAKAEADVHEAVKLEEQSIQGHA